MCIRDSCALLPACPPRLGGLGGHPAGWWAGAASRRVSKMAVSDRRRWRVRFVLLFPLPRANWPFGPL
eukprot:14885694-Alexandrium_andersonii.AAC.1